MDDFYAGPMYHLTYNPETQRRGADSGALWGLPRDVSTFVLYLNNDLIAEAGAADPRELAKNGEWTWDAFLEVAQKVRALGSDIYGYGANAWWGPYGSLDELRPAAASSTRTAPPARWTRPNRWPGCEFEQPLPGL